MMQPISNNSSQDKMNLKDLQSVNSLTFNNKISSMMSTLLAQVVCTYCNIAVATNYGQDDATITIVYYHI